MPATGTTTVLIVDDQREVAEAHAAQLSARYDVETAYSGEEALAALGPAIDVVLLDRRLPDVSGQAVLDAVRERDLDARVAMVTAVDPDFDVIDMPFDDYVVKPVTRSELFDTIEGLLTCAAYEDHLREYYALTSTYAALRAAKSSDELADNEEFRRLEAELERHRTKLDRVVDSFDESDFEVLMRDFRGPPTAASDVE